MNDDQALHLRNRAEVLLGSATTYWVSTVRPDGRPHATPVWGVWHDGCFWFTTFSGAGKVRNLAANPNIVVHFDTEGDVVVIEGRAERVDDLSVLPEISDLYAAKYVDDRSGEPYRPDDDLGEGAGGLLFCVRPTTGRAWAKGAIDEMSSRWTYDR